jgi:Uma2 family endonuclease
LRAAPELVVEVRSPSNDWSDIFTKVGAKAAEQWARRQLDGLGKDSV